MLIAWFFIAFALWAIKDCRREQKKSAKALVATCCHGDLEKYLFRMWENPTTTETGWIKILPACIWADEFWKTTHPGAKTSSLVRWVEFYMANTCPSEAEYL